MNQVVSYEEGAEMAQEFDLAFFEASAKQYINVEEVFTAIVTDVKNRLISEGNSGSERMNTVKLNPNSTSTAPQQRGCC